MTAVVSKDDRLAAANIALKSFAPDTTLRLESGYVLVEWQRRSGETFSKRWMCRGNDFYPVWYRQWCHGGTTSTALSQLVRWIQGKPVLSISSWRYWASEGVALLRQGDGAEPAIKALLDAGYPQQPVCVLCKKQIDGGIDWWNLNGVSGPCCGWSNGCRQKGGE